MKRTALVLEHWEVRGGEIHGREGRYSSKALAEQAAALWGGEVHTVEATYAVDDLVEVDAYNGWRPGTVVGLGRSKVAVAYELPSGTRIRSFAAQDIRPRSAS